MLPEAIRVVGCQPGETDRLSEGFSPDVARAVEPVLRELGSLVEGLGIAWS